MVEDTNNNKFKKCKKENWQLLVRIGLRQDDRLMEDWRQPVSQVQWQQKPAALRTQEMPDRYSQCVALTMAQNAAWFTLLATHHTSYWGFQSSGMWCCVTGCGSSNIWKDPLTCQDHSPSRTASYPRGPESSVACCENLKFCRMLLVWQNTECNTCI